MNDETRISGPLHRIGKGTRLSEIYEVDGLIGTGGMGEVYRGHAIETGDEVAIKTILPEFAQNESALGLFRKEASALHNLYHEAIVRYYVFTIDKTLGLPYLAMEYVTGDSLSDLVRKGPLGFDALGVLQRRLASGLQAAHELGIIHRDVSPDNIILPDGNCARAKIIDFGIARSTLAEKTIIGSGFAGKFGYVSPEQLGLFGGDVTGSSDIYSLGLVLAEAALGRPLDMGRSQVEVIDKRRRVPDLDGVDARLRPLLERMLQPDPAKRPASMAEVAAWTPAPSQTSSGGRRRLAVALAGLLALAGIGGAAFYLVPTGGERTPSSSRPQDQAGLTETTPPAPTPLAPSAPAAISPAPSPPAATPPIAAPATPSAATPAERVPEPVRPPAQPSAPAERIAPPPPTPAPRQAAAPTAEEVAAFVRGYSGGECVHLSPVSTTAKAATVEGFGAATPPFEAFDAEFQRALGFEPNIQLRLISRAQCPVVDLLARLAAQPRSAAPKLAIRPDLLKSGQELSGNAEAGGSPNLELLLVADDGLVHTITSFAKRTGDAAAFALRIEGGGAGAETKPQLVLAVASTLPLRSLKTASAAPAEKLFRQAEEEAAQTGAKLAAAIRYFKLSP